MAEIEKVKCLIIGSGPAGYTAAIYAGRANLCPVLYCSSNTETYICPKAARLCTQIFHQLRSADTFRITGEVFNIRSCRQLTAGLQSFITCATCDGFFYRKKVVAVVGGGDTACEEAVYLAGLASKVYLIVRKPFLRASKIMQERVMNHEKIEVLFEHNAVGLYGDNGVEGVNLVKRWGEPDEERYSLPIDGFFLAIGHQPNSDIFKDYLDTDEVGYIITDGASPRTKVPGVFAAGDVADPHYRQAITAAGSGCKAAIEAERYLSAKGLI